jgi:class 3 adenylate cyclase
MVSGNVGLAFLRQCGYSLISDAVNVAECLQTIAKTRQIIISGEVYFQTQKSFF